MEGVRCLTWLRLFLIFGNIISWIDLSLIFSVIKFHFQYVIDSFFGAQNCLFFVMNIIQISWKLFSNVKSAQTTFVLTAFIQSYTLIQYLVYFWDIPFYTKDVYERHLRASEIVTLISKRSSIYQINVLNFFYINLHSSHSVETVFEHKLIMASSISNSSPFTV